MEGLSAVSTLLRTLSLSLVPLTAATLCAPAAFAGPRPATSVASASAHAPSRATPKPSPSQQQLAAKKAAAKKAAAKKAAAKKAAAKKAAAKKAAATKVAAKKAPAKPKAPVTKAKAPITKAPAAATFVSRTTSHATPVKDSKGQVWAPRSVGYGTWHRSNGLVGKPIARTQDDVLYQSNAWGTRWYWVDVPAKATYAVRVLMAEDFWAEGGKRVFDIKAEGRVVAAGVDVAGAVGRAAAHEVRFTVPVTDGRLDLDFVALKDNPLVSAVEVVSTTPLPASAARSQPMGSAAVRLSPQSFYRQKVTNAPLAANSARTVARLAASVRDNWGGVAAFNAYQYNSGVYTVPANQPKVRVEFDDCQQKGYIPANLFTGRKQFLDVPVPPHAIPAKGTDGEMSIYDPAADKIWEFWQMRRKGSGWSACWGGRIDDLSTSQPIFTHPYGATATGLLLAGGMVSADDVRRGRIDHAIPIAVIDVARFDRFSWPANRSDGNSTDPDSVLEGQRLRLDPSIDVTSLDLTPIGQMVARAAQEYGFVVVDKGGAVAVLAESGEPEKALTGRNPWDTLLGGTDSRLLRNFPWERMQAIRPDFGKP